MSWLSDIPPPPNTKGFVEYNGVSNNKTLSMETIKPVFNKSFRTMSNLFFVYFLEYSITTAFTQSTTN